MKRRDLTMKAAVAALAAVAVRGTAPAQGLGARALQGVWDVQITNPPGSPLPTRRIITYHADGTVLDNSGAPGESLAQGVWEFTGSGVFEGTWWRYFRDAQGQIVGDVRVRSCIRMISDDEYENEAKIEVFGPSGQVLFSSQATGRGRRIKNHAFDAA